MCYAIYGYRIQIQNKDIKNLLETVDYSMYNEEDKTISANREYKSTLSEFLKEHRAEIESMLYTEFNLDIALEVRAEEVREETDAKCQIVIADKDAELADKDAELADKDAELADKDAELVDKDAEIALLHAKLEELQPS